MHIFTTAVKEQFGESLIDLWNEESPTHCALFPDITGRSSHDQSMRQSSQSKGLIFAAHRMQVGTYSLLIRVCAAVALGEDSRERPPTALICTNLPSVLMSAPNESPWVDLRFRLNLAYVVFKGVSHYRPP